ncbi:MAG: hypothetical protein Kow0063_33810 [Anaerolineae bacterium]
MTRIRDTGAYLDVLRETAHTLSGVLQASDVIQALLVKMVSARQTGWHRQKHFSHL